jgi:flagellar biosynthesis component FlhA
MSEKLESPAVTLSVGALLGAGLENSREQFNGVRDRLFEELGLIIPPIVVNAAHNLAGSSFQLHINGHSFDAVSTDTHTFQERLAKTLREQAAELLKPDLVKYYLMRVAASHPRLVEIVRHRFDLDSLTKALSARLQAGISIKDFSAALEALLSESIAPL